MYCVYLTTYHGDRMPKLYIGSGSVEKVNKGYRGTVLSKQYKKIWREELRDNPDLFETKILSEYNDRREAYKAEGELQRMLDVVRSTEYINMAYADEKSGFVCIQQTGEANTMYGKTHSAETKRKMSLAHTGRKCPRTPEHAKKIGEALRGRPLSQEHRQKLSDLKRGEKHNMFGIKKSDDVKAKIAATKRGSKWWTNGSEAKTSHECPGDGWQLGRKLKQEQVWNLC